jgi:lipopolysaccharide cholinephosphotransferase
LFIQTTQSDPEYVHCFAKIRNNNTTFIEISARKLNIHHGVFVDIFPLDYYPDAVREQKKFERKRKWYLRRVATVFDLPQNHTLKGRLKRLVMKLLIPSVADAVQKRDALYQTVPASTMIANHGGAWGKKEIVPAAWYGEGTKVMFEGMELMAPAEYDKWLTQVYGDYMQLPPVEKRVGHHYVEAVDLHAPYTQYMRNRK